LEWQRHLLHAAQLLTGDADDLTREIAAWAMQVAQLKRLIDEESEGASDEWVGAALRALRHAEKRLCALQGPDDRADAAVELEARASRMK
jgi:hypothetical protein